ncbi:hypothetical protein TSOC_010445 [Tetrabaena socialis]|uniref:Uncharacterized protein n=1 Tax=Tetrabaena socialis TaxID=47790 RepID=A0A2J7ZT84_9CHLO|nr:hypothetical protein TSOC_010445 [Tetrabaena socialis]|eukprot:PNH03481.1 hypothetical protein TSOC_010445 [Tetrabaena socialis]
MAAGAARKETANGKAAREQERHAAEGPRKQPKMHELLMVGPAAGLMATMTSASVAPSTEPRGSVALGASPATVSSVAASSCVAAPGLSAWAGRARSPEKALPAQRRLFQPSPPGPRMAASSAATSSSGRKVSIFSSLTTSASVTWGREASC